MKRLSQFTNFDWERFSKDKEFENTALQSWKDQKTGDVGSKLTLAIIKDSTDYGDMPEGEIVNNLYEKFTVKVRKEVSIPVGVKVRPVNAVAKVYGEFRNQLSVTAEDIKTIEK